MVIVRVPYEEAITRVNNLTSLISCRDFIALFKNLASFPCNLQQLHVLFAWMDGPWMDG
jgi:hypothetical protein